MDLRRSLSPGERYHRAALITGGYHLRGADRARAPFRDPPLPLVDGAPRA